MTINEISKKSSKDLQSIIYNLQIVDGKEESKGFLSDAQLDVLAENARVIEGDNAVIAAKKALNDAKLNAYYAKGSDTAEDAQRIMSLVLRKLVMLQGCKWDNKAQKFDGKGNGLYASLYSCGTDKLTHKKAVRHNGDNETPTMLRTIAEISGWLGDTCAEYVRIMSGIKKAKKGIAGKVKSYYQGCIDFDDTPDIAIAKAAKKFDLTEDAVKSYIK